MRNERGVALVVTLLVVVVVAILVLGTSFTSLLDRRVSANQEGAASAYYIAQSGLQHFKTLVFADLVDYYQRFENADWCVNPLSGGVSDGLGGTLESGESVTYDFGGGQYTVRYDSSGTYIVLTSVGRIGTSRATVQLVATSGAGPAGAWDNAIFATGQEAGTKKINGNVSVYGAVQIVNGEFELNTDLALDGKASVYNNYIGNPDNPGNSDVTAAMGRVIGGSETYFSFTELPDLCAKIKIEQGDLILHDNAARAGTDAYPIYSIHLGDGAVYNDKNKTQELTDHLDTPKVSLYFPEESGMNSGYEGYEVPFPKLAANYPNDMGFTVDPSNCPWLFDVDGNVVLPPSPTATVTTCAEDGNLVDWIPADGTTPAHLLIEGVINTGTALLSMNGTIYYEGEGAIRVGQCNDTEPMGGFEPGASCQNPDPLVSEDEYSVSLEGSIEPLGGGFPDTNVLGVVSTGDIWISNKPGAPDKEVAAVMAYSSGEITLDMQSLVSGAIVAAAFNMGNQVPKIAYHPDIREAAGLVCMPGAYVIEEGCEPGKGPTNPAAYKAPLSDVSYERR